MVKNGEREVTTKKSWLTQKKKLTNTIRQKTYKKKVRVQKRPLKGWLTTKKGWLTQNNTKKKYYSKTMFKYNDLCWKKLTNTKKGWPTQLDTKKTFLEASS